MNIDRVINYILGRDVRLQISRDAKGRIIVGEPVDGHLFRPSDVVNCRCIIVRKKV